jgi:hypothetical protein
MYLEGTLPSRTFLPQMVGHFEKWSAHSHEHFIFSLFLSIYPPGIRGKNKKLCWLTPSEQGIHE